MGCQSMFSSPIVLPAGIVGPPGAAGADGADGTSSSVLVNSIATPITYASPGDHSLVSGTLTGGTMSPEDVLEFEAYCTFSVAYIGSVTIKLGNATLTTHSIGAYDIYTPTIGSTTFAVILKSKVLFKTAATQCNLKGVNFLEGVSENITYPLENIEENSVANLTMDVRCNSTSGTVICNYFTVTHAKKA